MILLRMIQEKEFSKALTLRQAFGRAILANTKENQDSAKVALAKQIMESVGLLVPKKTEMYAEKLDRIINHAVALENDMTVEQALFVPFLPDAGMDPALQQYLKVVDRTQTGDPFICTFPAFGRKTEEGFFCISEGNVELESVLSVEKHSR